MMDIKKGDKIKVVKAFDFEGMHFKKGQVGKVLGTHTFLVCVEWRKEYEYMHDGGNCDADYGKPRHCWWIRKDVFEANCLIVNK